MINVYTKPSGGQKCYKGHVITLSQNVLQLAEVLPRCPNDLPVIVFTFNGKDNESNDFVVRRNKIGSALTWLVKNNLLYKHITIDEERLNALPKNGLINQQLPSVDFQSNTSESDSEDSDIEDFEIAVDRGSLNGGNESDLICDENTEMTSFLHLDIDTRKQSTLIEQQVTKPNQAKFSWVLEENPFNEFKTQYLAATSFPTLFPNSKGDPTNKASIRNISESETDAFAQKIKHLVKFREKVNGKWHFRFAAHPRFEYWAFNILYRRRLLSQGNFLSNKTLVMPI